MLKKIPAESFLFIIGAMKCGTSSLYDYLCSHPHICPCLDKEPEYFSSHQIHENTASHYEELFNFDPAIHQYAMEASTGYTKFPSEKGVVEKIQNYGIRPKLIYVVRNPFERIISHYNYMNSHPDFKHDITDSYLLDCSNYYLQLEQYTHIFGKESVLIIDFETLKKSPEDVLRNIYSFTGLEPTAFPENYEIKNAAVPVSKYDEQIKNSAKNPLSRITPKFVKGFIKLALLKIAPLEKVTLTASKREYIHNHLKEDMIKFGQKYHFDVSQWGFNQ